MVPPSIEDGNRKDERELQTTFMNEQLKLFRALD
jgi:hypothetical protein